MKKKFVFGVLVIISFGAFGHIDNATATGTKKERGMNRENRLAK